LLLLVDPTWLFSHRAYVPTLMNDDDARHDSCARGAKLEYYLYYKERRQLKTFLTQIRPTLPLMSDPPIICFWKWIGWKEYKVKKIVIWRVFLPKPKFFSHPPNTYPPYVPVGPTFAFHVAAHPELKKKPSSTPPRDSTRMARAPRAAAPPMLATTLLFASS
jgi:hypothetical protein